MLLEIPGRFSSIPGKHNLCIYDNYWQLSRARVVSGDREVWAYTLLMNLHLLLCRLLAVLHQYLRIFEGEGGAERSIEEFKCLSGGGNSRGWRFRRDEIHDRK